MATAPATAGGLRRRRARPWMAIPAVLVLLAAAFAAMDEADDDAARSADRESAAQNLVPTDSPTTTALGAQPVDTGGAGSVSSGRAAATRVSTGRATSAGSGSTPTTQPGSSTAGPTSTTPPESPPTTPPSESDPPDLSGLRAGGEIPDSEDRIFDDGACGSTTIAVEALATDGSGIRSMTLYWSFTGASGTVAGSRPMSLTGSLARATFGPFPPGTAPAGGVQITWYVEATDGAGNTARAYAPSSPSDERITLSRCG